MFTLAMPQSDPRAERNSSDSRRSVVKIADDSPWLTELCRFRASSISEYFMT